MSLVRSSMRLLALAALLLLAACTEEVITGVVLAGPEVPTDLVLAVPAVTPAAFVTFDTSTAQFVEPISEPALAAMSQEPSSGESEPYPDSYTASAIYNARTIAGFSPGYGYAQGENRYQGNKGSIETTATVRSQGSAIGSQTAIAENTTPFVIDFGRVKYITAFAKVYTDIACGLTVVGFSNHRASWQAVVGSPVSNYGETQLTSQSPVGHQPECAPPPPTPDPSGGGGGGGGTSDTNAICWFWIEYDLGTGQVYEGHLLYCTDGG